MINEWILVLNLIQQSSPLFMHTFINSPDFYIRIYREKSFYNLLLKRHLPRKPVTLMKAILDSLEFKADQIVYLQE